MLLQYVIILSSFINDKEIIDLILLILNKMIRIFMLNIIIKIKIEDYVVEVIMYILIGFFYIDKL
jgi:hypothetical protein